jgi:hypothetical protein
MKSTDLQKFVLLERENDGGPTKIFRDLIGGLCLRTLKRWCKMIDETGSIDLSSPTGCLHIIRTPTAIRKVKHRLNGRKRISARKLSKELKISRTSTQRILREDLSCLPYKRVVQPPLTVAHKAERKRFANWVRTNFS